MFPPRLFLIFFIMIRSRSFIRIENFTDANLIEWCDIAKNSLKIYVYDNPAPQHGCNKIRDYFKLEHMLPTYIKSSTVYTSNPEEADLFLVQHDLVCSGLSKYTNESYQSNVMDKIWSTLKRSKYYQSSNGSDHIFIFVCDNGVFCDTKGGACYLPTKYVQDIQNMIMIGNYGYSNSVPLTSGRVHPDFSSGCFRVDHDLTVPQYHHFFHCDISTEQLLKINHSKNYSAISKDFLTYFWGSHVKGLECSPGARPALKILKQTSNGQMKRVFEYMNRRSGARQSVFSFCPAGHACWSSRLYDAICSLSIPIIIAKGVIEPFERFFDWTSFTMKLDVENLTDGFIFESLKKYLLYDTKRRKWTTSLSNSNYTSILKLWNNLNAVRPWFSWKEKSPRNIWKLIILELFCRTKKGRHTRPCLLGSSLIAEKTYI